MTIAAPLPGRAAHGAGTSRTLADLLAGLAALAEAGCVLTPQGAGLVRHLKSLNRWALTWSRGVRISPADQ